MTKECFSPQEYARLQTFLNDPLMREAVRKALTKHIYFDGTIRPESPVETKNFAFACLRGVDGSDRTDEEVGKILRTIVEAAGLLESAFRDLDSLKEVKEEKKETKNLAR